MNQKNLSFFQTFNAMRIFLSLCYEKTHGDNVGMLLGGLRLFKDNKDWQKNPITWDSAAWEDWMDGINKTMQDLKITQNPKLIIYNDEMIFLCIKNYLQLFYDQFHFADIGIVLEDLKNTKHIPSDPTWQRLRQAIDHSINETYSLDTPLTPIV